MANSLGQTTSSSSKGKEASIKACRSSNDKISNLPDAVILRILSFLPTKKAVATSILSKRWVGLWTLVPTIDIDDTFRCRFDEEASMKFAHFFYRVLLLNKADSVKKFRLNCNEIYGQLCINTWLCSAIDRDLQELDICISNEEEEDIVKLPRDVFLINTLKVLKLQGGIMVDVIPSSVSLLSLKILHLLQVDYVNGESIMSFISRCQSLQELHIDVRIRPQTMVNFNISIPTLNNLSLTLHYDCHNEPHEEVVEINVPALEYLHYSSSGFIPNQYFIESFPSIIEADISAPDDRNTQLFRALNGVKFLRLTWQLDFLGRVRDTNNVVEFVIFLSFILYIH